MNIKHWCVYTVGFGTANNNNIRKSNTWTANYGSIVINCLLKRDNSGNREVAKTIESNVAVFTDTILSLLQING